MALLRMYCNLKPLICSPSNFRLRTAIPVINSEYIQKRSVTKRQAKPHQKRRPRRLNVKLSGDQTWQVPQVDLKQYQMWYNHPDLLAKMDPSATKFLTLEYADGRTIQKQRILEAIRPFQYHPYDFDSFGVQVARWTVKIRSMMYHHDKNRGDRRAKMLLNEGIQKRQKIMKKLRRTDLQMFMYLLKTLKLQYRVRKRYSNLRIGKKKLKLRAQLKSAFMDRKFKKMDHAKNLKREQDMYLKHKKKVIKEIELQVANMEKLQAETKLLEEKLKSLRMG